MSSLTPRRPTEEAMIVTVNEPSRGERKIMELLHYGGLKFQREVSFEGLVGKKKVPLRFDFAVYNSQG
jgi:hypothetical protein